MNNLKYAMEKSYDYMVEEINNILAGTVYSVEERQRLFYACGTCLHWILDYAERVEVSEEKKKTISAFKFANNALKHDNTLIQIVEQTGGFSFPFSFPMEIPSKKVCWKDIEVNGKFENQHKNYVQCLRNEDVIITCKEVIELLVKCKAKLI